MVFAIADWCKCFTLANTCQRLIVDKLSVVPNYSCQDRQRLKLEQCFSPVRGPLRSIMPICHGELSAG